MLLISLLETVRDVAQTVVDTCDNLIELLTDFVEA